MRRSPGMSMVRLFGIIGVLVVLITLLRSINEDTG